MPARIPRIHWLVPVLAVALIAAAFIRFVLIPRALVVYDEADYLYTAKEMVFALRTADWSTIAALFSQQFEKTSFPSLVYGLLLLPAGFSVTVARTVNLVFFVGSVVLTGVLAGKAAPENTRRPAMLTAAGLFAVSPLLLFLGSVFMREMIGIFLTLAAVLAYLAAQRRPYRLIWVSVIALALASVKYNYGILTLAVIAVGEIVTAAVRFKKSGTGTVGPSVLRLCLLGIPFALLLLVWLTVPVNRIGQFVSILKNEYYVTSGLVGTADQWLYYPRAILYLYSPTLLVGILILSGILLSLRYIGNPAVGICILLFAANLILGVRNSQNLQERFFALAVPGAFVLSAVVWTDLTARFLRSASRKLRAPIRRPVMAALTASGILLLGTTVLGLPQTTIAAAAYSFKSPVFNQPDFRDLWFVYDPGKWARTFPAPNAQTMAGLMTDIAGTIDIAKPVYWIGESNEFSPWYRQIAFDPRLTAVKPQDDFARYAVIFTVRPGSRFYTRDYTMTHEWKQGSIPAVTGDQSWVLIRRTSYDGLGIDVTVYGQR
jgi:hypothetical protein